MLLAVFVTVGWQLFGRNLYSSGGALSTSEASLPPSLFCARLHPLGSNTTVGGEAAPTLWLLASAYTIPLILLCLVAFQVRVRERHAAVRSLSTLRVYAVRCLLRVCVRAPCTWTWQVRVREMLGPLLVGLIVLNVQAALNVYCEQPEHSCQIPLLVADVREHLTESSRLDLARLDSARLGSP
jgi:hypothetical protein